MATATELKSGFSKRDLVYLLFKRRPQIIRIFAIAFVLVVIGSYVFPRIYEAYATVYIVRTVPPIPGVLSPHWRFDLERTAVLNSEVDFIRSRLVAERVADQLLEEQRGLPADGPEPSGTVAAIRGGVEAFREKLVRIGLVDTVTEREGLIGWIQSEVDAKPGLQSDMITISLRTDNPAQGAKVVNLVTDAFLEGRLKLMARPGLDEFYETRLTESRAEIERLEAEIQKIKDRIGVVDIEGELDVNLTELADLKSELSSVRVLRDGLRKEIEFLTEQSGTRSYRPEAAKREEALETELYQSMTELAGYDAREQSLLAEIGKIEAELPALDGSVATLKHLEASIQSAERTYFSHLEQREQEMITARTDPGMTNVRVLHYAAVPGKPVFGRLALISMGAGLGLLVALSFAFVSEAFDHTLNTRDDVEQYLGLPLIASVPVSKDLRKLI
jgi:uncharacterized protein involved in exopolysaccharide biosynthesis